MPTHTPTPRRMEKEAEGGHLVPPHPPGTRYQAVRDALPIAATRGRAGPTTATEEQVFQKQGRWLS